MLVHHCVEARGRRMRMWLAAAVVATSVAWPAGPASAEGLLDFFFGGFRPAPATPAPLRANHAGDPRVPPDPSAAGSGRSVAFCVRQCDGRHFPMQRHNGATPTQACNALCPASRTKIFFGSEIGTAVAADGSRYADLDNAFVYRERLVPNCTCNGRDAFGLTPVDVNADPTLRPGDLVATQTGLMAYTGLKPRRGTAQAGEFTPVKSSGLPAELRGKLATANTASAD